MDLDGAVSEVLITGELLAVDLSRAAWAGAKSGAVSGSQRAAGKNIAAVINGEKDIEDAAVDTLVETAQTTLTSAASSVGIEGTKVATKKNSEKLIEVAGKEGAKEIVAKSAECLAKVLDSASQNIGGIVTATMTLANVISRYANGDIDGEELILEMGQTGSDIATSFYFAQIGGLIGGILGTVTLPFAGTIAGEVVGEFIGGMVGYVVSSLAYPIISNILQGSKVARERAEDLHRMCEISIKRTKKQRMQLELASEIFFAEQKKQVTNALDIISSAMVSGDVDKFGDGMNMITKQFGGVAQFNNADEFCDFMEDDSTVFVF